MLKALAYDASCPLKNAVVATFGNRLTLAVAIPTYNREQVLLDTIRLVLAQDPPADEVLIIDQSEAHGPRAAEQLQEYASGGSIRWIRQSPPNLPAARNRALRETSCDVVLFFDDDVVPKPGCLEHHRRHYVDDTVHAVAGRTTQRTPPDVKPVPAGIPLNRQFLYFDFTSEVPQDDVAALLGANHSVRRSTALALQGYDENFIGWAFREETDLALRMLAAHNRIIFDPEAEVLHLLAPGGGCRLSRFADLNKIWLTQFLGMYFAWKHLFPSANFWTELLVTFRQFVVNKRNVLNPYRLPIASVSYVFSFFYSYWKSVGSAHLKKASTRSA